MKYKYKDCRKIPFVLYFETEYKNSISFRTSFLSSEL